MSHTIRAYNKKPLNGGPGYCGWITSNKITTLGEWPNVREVVLYHPHAQWCMGNCPHCKDAAFAKKRRIRYQDDMREQVRALKRAFSVTKYWDDWLTWDRFLV